MVAQSGFDVPRFVKATLKQQLNSGLGCGTSQRGEKRIPLGRDLRIGRQTVHVDQSLRLGDRLLVERRDPRGESVNEPVEFGVR